MAILVDGNCSGGDCGGYRTKKPRKILRTELHAELTQMFTLRVILTVLNMRAEPYFTQTTDTKLQVHEKN